MSTASERHANARRELHDRYTARGYRVTVDPRIDPALGLGSFRPDLVAEKDDEHIAIVVKPHPGTPDEPSNFAAIVARIARLPSWRFVLALAGPSDVEELELPDIAAVQAKLTEAESRTDIPADAALLFAWAIFEAAAQLALIRQGAVPSRPMGASALIQALTFHGLISQADASFLRSAAEERNKLAHGRRFGASANAAPGLLREAGELLRAAG